MAVRSEYPINGDPIVRGDPHTIRLNISRKGVLQDITGWSWRAHIRRSADAPLVTAFTIDTETPSGGAFPSRLLLSLTPDQTRILRTGMTFDLEQLDPNHATPVSLRTWWICTKLNVTKDVSRDG